MGRNTRSYHQTKVEAVTDLSDALIAWALAKPVDDADVLDH